MDTLHLHSDQSLTDGTADSLTARAAARKGDVCAEGGGLPRLVIRGERLESQTNPSNGERYQLVSKGSHTHLVAHPLPKVDGVAFAAITDYLNCTFPFHSSRLPDFFPQLFACLGEKFAPAKDRKRGLHGYTNSFTLGATSAFFAYGGQSGTGFLTIPGEACHMIPDWVALTVFLRDSLQGRITRWDGAVDDFEGGHPVDYAVKLYQEGKFTAGGNEPSCSQNGNWIKPDGKGRTLYIGKRENGKMLRVYEKGMQLGAAWHPWVRWEVEMHNVDRVIPWEVLLEPGKYVAGAYPNALNWVQEEMQRIRTLQKTATLSYEHLAHYASVAYGKLINVMLQVEGSPEKVLKKLSRSGLPSRLDLPPLPGIGKVMP